MTSWLTHGLLEAAVAGDELALPMLRVRPLAFGDTQPATDQSTISHPALLDCTASCSI